MRSLAGQYPPLETPIPDYVGLKNIGKQQEAALQMGAPYVQASETIKAEDDRSRLQSEKDDDRRKAEGFRQVLAGGPDLMYKFSDEVGQKYPDFGKQLRAQVDGYAPLFKDPKLDRPAVQDLITDFYKNATDRMNDLDKSSRTDPLMELKKRKLEAEIERIRAMAALARATKGKNKKNADALGKAWQIADKEETDASTDLETLLKQQTGTHSPRWQEEVDLLQSKILKAQQSKQTVLRAVDDPEFFNVVPDAAPEKVDPNKPPKGKKVYDPVTGKIK